MNWDERTKQTGNLIKLLCGIFFFWKYWQRSHGREPDAVKLKAGETLLTKDGEDGIITIKDVPKEKGDLE